MNCRMFRVEAAAQIPPPSCLSNGKDRNTRLHGSMTVDHLEVLPTAGSAPFMGNLRINSRSASLILSSGRLNFFLSLERSKRSESANLPHNHPMHLAALNVCKGHWLAYGLPMAEMTA